MSHPLSVSFTNATQPGLASFILHKVCLWLELFKWGILWRVRFQKKSQEYNQGVSESSETMRTDIENTYTLKKVENERKHNSSSLKFWLLFRAIAIVEHRSFRASKMTKNIIKISRKWFKWLCSYTQFSVFWKALCEKHAPIIHNNLPFQ